MTTKTKILIVNDNKEILGSIKGILDTADYKVTIARDIREAVSKFNNDLFDMVIGKLKIGKANADELIDKIRDIEMMEKRKESIPILILCGSVDNFKSELGLQDHVTCLEQPFTGADLLKKIEPYLMDKPDEETQENNPTKIQIASGESLIAEGDENNNSMYWVVSGSFAVYKSNDLSELVEIGMINKGELVGEMSFLDNEARSATVMAIENSEVLEIPSGKFQSVIDDQPRWFKSLLRTLSSRLRDANVKIGT